MKKYLILLFFILGLCLNAISQNLFRDTSRIGLHFQQTIVGQYHLPFSAPYTGMNSLLTREDPQTSLTSTLYLGFRAFKRTYLFFNPEVAGGAGLSQARGIAGFPNGETFRVGDPSPVVYVARIFFKTYIPLGTDEDNQESSPNQLGGKFPKNYLSISGGKICLSDFFDINSYSHDPRSQFLNWSLMSNGAWDYPANTRGYTWGMVFEYVKGSWSAKFGETMVGKEANGPYMDMNIAKAHAETFEIGRSYECKGRMGCVRLLLFNNLANMGSYQLAINDTQFKRDISLTRSYGRHKQGFGIGWEQELSSNTGAFARISWNDGKNETWAFTEIDQSISAGLSFKGNKWKRPEDVLGIAGVINGISKEHRNYLESGGYGFIIGDGELNYAPEYIAESYYSFHLQDYFTLSTDLQLVLNPAYNASRKGPVLIPGLRGHFEF